MIDPATLKLSSLEQQYGLPQGLLAAVMHTESGGNPSAVSPAGAQGLFQFMPATAQQYGIDPNDPAQAAQGAARMYGDLSKKYNGDIPSMLAAYNWGQGNLDKSGLANAPQETQNYINKVQGLLPKQVADSGQIMSDASPDNRPSLDEIFGKGNAERPSLEQIFGEVKQAEAPKKEDGILSRISNDISTAANKGADILTDGTRNPLSAALQVGGQAADMVAAPFVEAAKSTYNALPSKVTTPINSALASLGQTGANAYNTGVNKLANTGIGQAIGNFGMEHPQLADQAQGLSDAAKAAGTLATLAPLNKGIGATGSALEKIGGAASTAADTQVAANKAKFAQDLVTPKQTASVKLDQVGRTTEQGPFNRKVVQPSAEEKQMAAEVAKLPVSTRNTVQGNYNIIANANKAEAETLKDQLLKNDVSFPRAEFNTHLDAAVSNLSQNPLLTGDAEQTAQRIVDKFKMIADAEKSSASGVLEARKKLDKWIAQQKGQGVFDPTKDNAVSAATREIRQSVNDFIDRKVTPMSPQDLAAKQKELQSAINEGDKLNTLKKTLVNTVQNNAKQAANSAKSLPSTQQIKSQSELVSSLKGVVDNHPTPMTNAELASHQSALQEAVNEYEKLKDLHSHVQGQVKGAVDFSNRQGGFWKSKTITQAAQDAKNIPSIKSQIEAQKDKISKIESIINSENDRALQRKALQDASDKLDHYNALQAQHAQHLERAANDAKSIQNINNQIKAHERVIEGIREALNNNPKQNVAVKESLRKQNLLYRAMDNIAPKAADEAQTAIGRTFQRLDNVIPKSNLGKLGVLGGTAAGGALAAIAPGAVVAGGTIYGAKKALQSVALKRGIGATVGKTGSALRYLAQ